MSGTTIHWINVCLGAVIFIATGIGHGAVQLDYMIPKDWQDATKAWCTFISWFGTGYLTLALGLTTPAQ